MIDTTKNYWFFLESYTFLSFSSYKALLYNSLDGESVEVSNGIIRDLLCELYEPNNGGVILLSKTQLNNPQIYSFVNNIREKYIGDIIDTSLSTSKPTQLIALHNLQYSIKRPGENELVEIKGNIMSYLHGISIYVDDMYNEILIEKLNTFLYQLESVSLFIIGDIFNIVNHERFVKLLNALPSKKTICCSYTQIDLERLYLIPQENYKIEVEINFPFIENSWKEVWSALLKLNYFVEVVFNLISTMDIQQAEDIIDKYSIENFRLKPVYTGNNLMFFQEYIFLEREDILATPLSMREIFAHQELNTFDFGKISIKSNGDIYANINHLPLGNIKFNNIHEIVCKELNEGQSWLRIRNQKPCSDCIYQWLCPSPSNYELAIGKPNLCHVKP